MFKIYRITNLISGKVYIGQTSQTVAKRIYQHIANSTPIGTDMKEKGIENFSVETIDMAETKQQINELEKFWIAFHGGNEYNVLSGGDPTKEEMHMINKMRSNGKKLKKKKKKKKTS